MSADAIGNLVAVVKATADQFAGDMRQIKQQLSELRDKAKESGESVKNAFELGAGIEAAKVAFEKIKEVAEQFFGVFEKAHKLEVLAEELNSTASELSGFTYAAQSVGQEAESFQNALGKMVQKIGEAREGSAETSVAFQALGLNVNKLAGMSAGGALEEIAEKIREIPSHADRAALAVELFGKSGRDMLPMLEQGRDGIEALIAKGRDLGVVLGAEQATKLAEAQRNIREMKMAWEGLATTLASDVAPMLSGTIQLIEKGIGVASKLVELHKRVVSALPHPTFKDGSFGMDPGFLISGEDKSQGLELAEQRRAIGEALKRKQSEEMGQNIVARFKETQAFWKKWREDQAKAEEDAARISERSQERHAEMQKKFAREAFEVIQNARSPMQKFADELNRISYMLEEGRINFEQYQQAAAKAGAEVERAFDKHKEKPEVSLRSGIAGADLETTTGASLDLAAGRAAVDMQLAADSISEQQLEEEKRHTQLLQMIANAAGRTIDLNVADF